MIEECQKELHKVLVLLAHFDDEVFLTPFLDSKDSLDNQFLFIYLTDSAGKNGKFDPIKRLSESVKFFEGIGIHYEIAPLGIENNFEDGSLHTHLETAAAEVVKYLTKAKFNPSMIYSLKYEGGHQDHDSVGLLATTIACSRSIELLHFPTYRAHSRLKNGFTLSPIKSSPDPEVFFKLSSKTLIRLLGIPVVFSSQWKTWVGLYIPILLKANRGYFFKGWPAYKPSINDYASPPYNKSILYERRNSLTYSGWRKFVDSYLESITRNGNQ